MYNVHEKSLIEGECELNYQKHRGQRGKKAIIFLHILIILTQKTCTFVFLCGLLTTLKLHVNVLSVIGQRP